MSVRGTSRVRAVIDLARAGNFPSVASNVLAALVLASLDPADAWPSLAELAVALVGGWLAYAGGATLNDVFDARFDAERRPERAIPRRVVSRAGAAWLGAIELTAGLAVLIAAGASAAWALALGATILAYDWLHKRWAGSVMLMAGCRGLLALTIATLPGHAFTLPLLAWVSALFVYIVGLSVIARREYAVAQASSPAPEKSAGRDACATKSGVARKARFSVGGLLAFIPLIDAIALLLVGAWGPAMACAAAVPLGRWAQRLAAST